MASMMSTEFVKASNLDVDKLFGLIEHKGLFARLGDELSRAANELIHDPRGFLGGMVSPADTRDQKRRRLIYIGLGSGLLAHAALLVVVVIAGWHRIMEAPKVVDPKPDWKVTLLDPTRSKSESGKTSAPKGEEHVSGGGGQQNPEPASAGTPQQSLPMDPIIRANPSALESPTTLPVTPNVEGPEGPPPPKDAAPGVQNGKPGDFSAGPGTGDGLGGKSGSGTGPKSGTGGPQGGSGKVGSPDGGRIDANRTGISSLMFNEPKPQGFVPLRWLYRPTPVVTPEAQANKVSGTVLVIATFNADGTITDIELKNPVPYMTDSAIDSLKRSRFRPASVDGKPITLFRVPVRIDVELAGRP